MGKTSPNTNRTLRREMLSRPPTNHRTPATGRTTARGDRSGLRRPQPRVDFALRRNGNEHTKRIVLAYRDKETGRIHGAKIAPCRACGKVRTVSTATLLCTVRGCLTSRPKALGLSKTPILDAIAEPASS